MEITDIYDFCLSKKGTSDHFPFDEDTLVFKVGGKMFLLATISKWENGKKTINVKCDPEKAMEQREEYAAVEAGYHMSKKHWNTIDTKSDMPVMKILECIEDSYELVVDALTKKIQKEILES